MYKRQEQGIVADYVVIMGYDEHYAGSPEAGSVSSYNYVKDGIEATLEEVPKEKVISGIPFFTRLWEETPKTEEELAEQAEMCIRDRIHSAHQILFNRSALTTVFQRAHR